MATGISTSEEGRTPPMEAGRRRVRRTSEEIRSLILDAARAVFAERGFAGGTTRLIAERASVAEPLIFNNFGGKAALFDEAVIQPFNLRFTDFLAISDDLPPDREMRSAQFVHAVYPFLRDNADLLHALVKSAGDMQVGAVPGLDDYFTRAADRMRSQYELRGLCFDVAPELVVRYCFGMLAGSVLLSDWFFPTNAPEDSVAEGALARLLYKASEPRDPEREN